MGLSHLAVIKRLPAYAVTIIYRQVPLYYQLFAVPDTDLVLDVSRDRQSDDEDSIDGEDEAVSSLPNMSSLTLEETRSEPTKYYNKNESRNNESNVIF